MLELYALKIGRDLWYRRRQTALVVLAISFSVFTVSGLARARFYLVYSLDQAFVAASLPQAVFLTGGFEDDVLATLRARPDLPAVEGVRPADFRFKFGAERWNNLELTARADLAHGPIAQLQLTAGRWPTAGEAALVLERSARDLTAAGVGDTVMVYTDDLGEMPVQVVGLVYAPAVMPTQFAGNKLIGYTTPDTLRQLLGGPRYAQLYVRWADTLPPDAQQSARRQIEQVFSQAGVSTSYVAMTDLVRYPLTRYVETAILILSLIGALGLGLSIVWVTSVMTEWMTQERNTLGVLKTLGFTRGCLFSLYVGEALAIGGLAWPVGVLAGAAVAEVATQQVAVLLNVDLRAAPAPGLIYGLEALVGLGVPLLATGYPVWATTRITVRQALQHGPSALDQSAREGDGPAV